MIRKNYLVGVALSLGLALVIGFASAGSVFASEDFLSVPQESSDAIDVGVLLAAVTSSAVAGTGICTYTACTGMGTCGIWPITWSCCLGYTTVSVDCNV